MALVNFFNEKSGKYHKKILHFFGLLFSQRGKYKNFEKSGIKDLQNGRKVLK